MRILHSDLRHGIVKLKVENIDDLWYLSGIIRSGDIVKSKTERRVKAKEDIIKAGKSERKTITVSIRVEKSEFSSDSNSLRISGTIAEGPEDLVAIGSHHTLAIEKGSFLAITKEPWSEIDIDRIKDAEKAALRPKILIAVIDEGNADFGLVSGSRIEFYDLSKAIGGKYDTSNRIKRKMEFYQCAAEFISKTTEGEGVQTIIIAGAGFEKENFYGFLSERYPELKKIAVVENICSYGRVGINEVMKRPILREVTDKLGAVQDARMVNELLEHVGRDTGLGIYGLEDIENAANMGAIEKLIICDDFLQKDRNRVEIIIKNVKSATGKFHIVNHESDAGKQLNSLGGIAAILRFRIR